MGRARTRENVGERTMGRNHGESANIYGLDGDYCLHRVHLSLIQRSGVLHKAEEYTHSNNADALSYKCGINTVTSRMSRIGRGLKAHFHNIKKIIVTLRIILIYVN